ncbi:MAG: inositol-3-phosphate synthase [Nitrospinae bacterium RIFCSPLOWO2_12_FULL_47_7]|nr:MAG: inositol-3-phosphate synthase [Nitrospinae bacterium RIFCSPLOWO2_12_FULL_47_7]
MKKKIKPAKGKLGVLLPGMGAVTSTLIAGVFLINKGLGLPLGSVTQMSRIRLGKRSNPSYPLIKDFVALAKLKDLVFGGWDIYKEDCYQAALTCGVIAKEELKPIKKQLEAIKPWPAVFDKEFIRNISGPNIKSYKNKMDAAEQLMKDIESFKRKNKLDRMVMCWCGSTEVYKNVKNHEAFKSINAFEKALKNNLAIIPPSMIYAYAAIRMGVPYANGSPNLSGEIPALVELAARNKTPVAGKDFKTGQTLMKTIVAPGLKARMLGLKGWFSSNILGNRDGEVLDDPGSFRAKEVTKSSVLGSIFQDELYPELYGDYYHKVRIEYYPPRGDAKEGWDNIDITGWLGQPMQLKINFLCRDSILAAPVALDLILFLDLAQRAGMSGIQEWLSFYFKEPVCRPDLKPENDLFVQDQKLRNTLRIIMGEEVIDHSGLDYYDKGV